MYVDQQTLDKMGTARLIARYAPDYADYLGSVFGRPFYLSGPAEMQGPTRLLARFVSDEAASGEDRSPTIKLWVEFNPAMGLYTVWGEYWKNNEAQQPLYRSSPRTGFDDELLGDPARVFDWLDQSVSMGEERDSSDDEEIEEMTDRKEGAWYANEMLRMAGVDGSERMADRRLSDDLLDEKSRKQARAAKKAEKVAPPKKVGPFSTAMTPERAKLAKTLKQNPNVRDPERLAFWIGLRMAGKKGGTNESQESSMQIPNINSQLEAIRIALEGKMKCEGCGCEVMEEEAVEMDDGEMLCEECASDMEEGVEYDDEDLDEAKGAILATVPSSSDPSKSYEIRMGNDGNVYCSCPAWKYQKVPPKERTCKHIKSLYKAMDSQAKLKLPKDVKEGTAFPLSGGEFLVLAEDLDVIAEMLSENSGCGCDDADDVQEGLGTRMLSFAADSFNTGARALVRRGAKHLAKRGDRQGAAEMGAIADKATRGIEKVRKDLGSKGCKPGQKMVFGFCRAVESIDPDLLDALDALEEMGVTPADEDELMEALETLGEESLTEKAQSKFKKLVSKLKKRGDIRDPAALASWIGAKKLGKGNVEKGRKMLQKMAVKARKAKK